MDALPEVLRAPPVGSPIGFAPNIAYGALAFAVLLDGQLGFALEVSYFAIMRDKPPQRRFVAVRNVTCRDTLGGADWRGAPPTERI
jgi:hypothetical protein